MEWIFQCDLLDVAVEGGENAEFVALAAMVGGASEKRWLTTSISDFTSVQRLQKFK